MYRNIRIHQGNCTAALPNKPVTLEEDIQETIYLFPNPGNGVFNIQMNGNFDDDIFLSLFSMLGNKVSDQLISKNDQHKTIPLSASNLNPGIYFYQWRSGQKTGKGKLEVISN